MLPEVKEYLEQVHSHLRLDPVTERQVISELYTHFEEKITDLQVDKGASEKDATKAAIESFGRARVVARLMYEAYSKGSWDDAVMASLPHLLIAGLFTFHLWHHPLIAPIVFISIVGVTLFGWWHGKPNWLYSWIGYSLLPLLIGGYTSAPTIKQAIFFILWGDGSLPNIWLLLLIVALVVLSIWIIIRTTIRVVKRDWILVSMMLVPLPIFGSWLFNIEQASGLFQSIDASLHLWDTPMALAFAVLGITAAAFIRLRQRVLKVGAVIVVGSIALAMVGHNLWGELGFFGLVALFLFMLAFLFTPALVEARVGHGDEKLGTIWNTYPEQSSIMK